MRSKASLWWFGLVLSIIVVVILGVTGLMDGERAYRYKTGVIEVPDVPRTAERPDARRNKSRKKTVEHGLVG